MRDVLKMGFRKLEVTVLEIFLSFFFVLVGDLATGLELKLALALFCT